MYSLNHFIQRPVSGKYIQVAFYLLTMLFGFAPVLNATPEIQLEAVITGLNTPVAITHAGDGSGRLFVTQLSGQIIIFDGNQKLSNPFLDIGSLVSTGGERGLFSVAFHPEYSINGFLFVNYTDRNGDSVVARYSVSPDPNVVDANSAFILLTVVQPFANHNGGQLQFGPDGYLYIGMGDGGSGGDPLNNAQTLGSLLGKMLRIDVDGGIPYSIPPDNPLLGDPGAREEIWALGLRNPWRFSFDRLTGDLFIADVGQGTLEEVNFQPFDSLGGENYGWRLMEGSNCFNPTVNCDNGTLILPILEYGHTIGRSITGGYRYRGSQNPGLEGVYFYGDFVTGLIWGATQNNAGEWTTIVLLDTDLSISAFGEDENGEVYLADFSSGDGIIFRISAGNLIPRYRLYNPFEFSHHSTINLNEYIVLGTLGWNQEGIAYHVYDDAVTVDSVQATPFFRLYNPNTGNHHWTSDANEYNVLGSMGWTQEGIDGYIFMSQVTDSIPLYRLYNPFSFSHLWTTDLNERNVLVGQGWNDEGVAGYVFSGVI